MDDLDELWDYSKDFVSHKFKKEARRLGIPDIRFHDLRRTFGYNLIRQGRPIYEAVSYTHLTLPTNSLV